MDNYMRQKIYNICLGLMLMFSATAMAQDQTVTGQVVDENGISHDISIYRPVSSHITFNIDITAYAGFDAALADTVRQAVTDYVSPFGIGRSLMVPSVYGVCYAAAGEQGDG